MEKFNYFIVTLLTFFSSLTAVAQYVESGSSIINCRTIPYNARRMDYTRFVPTHTEKDYSNLLPNKFEVAKTNANNKAKATWDTARSACERQNGGGWRLPTQREMQIIVLLSNELTSQGGFESLTKLPPSSKDNPVYWTHTRDSRFNPPTSKEFYYYIVEWNYDGTTISSPGSTANFVRCVREIADPTIQ